MAVQKYIISIIVISMLVLTGCPKTNGDNGGDTASGAFVGGEDGLIFKFIEQAPPSIVYDTDNPFSISILLENEGEYTIEENSARPPVITITGIDYADFSTTNTVMTAPVTEELLGRQLNPNNKITRGTITTVEFPTGTGDLDYAGEVAGTAQFTFRAEICYEYVTKAQAMLCVREDLLGTKEKEGVCEPNRALQAENSGAPVHVESLEQSVQGSDKIYFDFKVVHTGGGSIYKNGLTPSCSADTRSNKNKVWVEIENPNLGDFSCSGLADGTGGTDGYVTLTDSSNSVNEEGHVRCTIKLTETRDLEKVLKIKLLYDYYDSVDTQVQVKHGS